jgi:hypothetical protein
MLLNQAGYQIDLIWVDGLDWESADRFHDQAADEATQKRGEDQDDQSPENWARRFSVALEFINAGLEAYQRKRRL